MQVLKLLLRRSRESPASEPPIGLKILSQPEDPNADIVFVHGLNGHQVNTWRQANAVLSWPEAILSHDMPRARIMAYGYDARVTDWKGFLRKVSVYGIQQQTQNMLETLASQRADEKATQRPIIFVCHSMGGILCKHALVRSHAWINEAHISALCKSTRGIIFLGTPHGGAEIAVYASLLAKVVGVLKQTNLSNIRQLQKDSAELRLIQEDFDRHLRSRRLLGLPPIETKCFYEERPITGIGVIVDYQSAVLTGNIPVGIAKDHRDMTRFENAEEVGYKIIKYTMQRWLDPKQGQLIRPQAASLSADMLSINVDAPKSSPPNNSTPKSPWSSSTRSSSPGYSSGSSFVKIPPSGRFIVNENLVSLPFEYIPLVLKGRDSRYFQPRDEEMKYVESALFSMNLDPEDPTATNHRICTITGLGGVGKTELSYRFYDLFKNTFDAVFFTVADSRARLREEFGQIAVGLGLVEPIDQKNSETCCEIFKSWLSNPVKGTPETGNPNTTVKWLLVFDNAESSDVIDEFWPAGCGGKIIITSRNPLVAPRNLLIAGNLRLDGLKTKDAAQLLRVCTNEIDDNEQSKEDASAIAEWVEGIPMAIEQLGHIIFNEHLTISQFRRIWSTKEQLVRRLYSGHDNNKVLITSWALETLQSSQKDSFALLALISLLDSEQIPQELLIAGLETVKINGWSTTEESYISARKCLADTSLIDVSRETGDIRVHRLVQDLMRDLIVRTGQAASFFQGAVYRVAAMWPFLNKKYVTGTATNVERWKRCSPLFPHILYLRSVHDEFVRAGVETLASSDLAELLLEAVHERGAGHEAISLLETADSIYTDKYTITDTLDMDEVRAKVYRGRIALAVSSRDGNNLLHYAQLAFDIEKHRHRATGSVSSILAVAFNDLATGWAFYRQWNVAIQLLSESKKMRESLPGFTRDKLFSPLYHLGVVYHHQRNYIGAEEMLGQAIKDREALFGPKDKQSIRSAALYYAYGNMRMDRSDRRQGDLLKALSDFKNAVEIATACAGAKSRATLLCQYHVARALVALQDDATACEVMGEVLTQWIDNPMYDRDTARMSYLYAQCLEVLGNAKESESWRLKSLDYYNRIEPEHPKSLHSFGCSDIAGLISYDFL